MESGTRICDMSGTTAICEEAIKPFRVADSLFTILRAVVHGFFDRQLKVS